MPTYGQLKCGSNVHPVRGRSTRAWPLVLALASFGAASSRSLAAQAPPPLDKAELIRLLTNPLFAQTEVAEVVRRSCLTFRPTERDWADIRYAGASGEVIASAAACDSRRPSSPRPITAAPEPEPTVTAAAQPAEIVTIAGTPATVRVRLSRGRTPVRRATLVLRGSTSLGLTRDASAVTDDSGIAVFTLPPVVEPGTHRFEIMGNSGSTFPGRPAVSFTVRPGEPARLRVTPDYIASPDRGATIVATVTDSLGNPLGQEPVELNLGAGAPLSAATDSVGRASFVLTPNALPRGGGTLQVRVRKLAPVEVPIADIAGLSGPMTGFVVSGPRRGRVGSPLSAPLIFRARTVQGSAASGRVVRFRAANAQIKPDSAVLDSTGLVSVDVIFGARAGEAMIVARIDSVERLVTLPVDPGPIVSLVLEYAGRPVTGRRISVPVATPFELRLTARDLYGNQTPIDALGQLLRSSRPPVTAQSDLQLDLVNLDVGESVVLITLKARRLGMYDFTVGSGITANVGVTAIAK